MIVTSSSSPSPSPSLQPLSLLSLDLGAERCTCRNMFGFGYSQNLVSELNFICRNPKLLPKSQTIAEIPNHCQNPKPLPKSKLLLLKSQSITKILKSRIEELDGVKLKNDAISIFKVRNRTAGDGSSFRNKIANLRKLNFLESYKK